MDRLKRQLFLIVIQFILACFFAVPSGLADVRVFVTSQTYQGNLGGADEADAKCQACADVAEIGGVWKAWICSSTTSATERLTHFDENYVRAVDGTIIANNWSDLTDGSLDNAILKNENGVEVIDYVWTGCYDDGTYVVAYCCDDWNSNDGLSSGPTGTSNVTTNGWTYAGTSRGCSGSRRLYCFEEPTPPTLLYSSTTFTESLANDGTISNTLTITYSYPDTDYFTGANGTFDAGKYTATNVPDGLTMVITKNSNTELSVALTGAATSHEPSDDVSNLGIAFNNLAFNNGDASAVTNASRSDISVLFNESTAAAGNCLEFDGINDYIEFGADSPPYSGTLTVEAWIKTTSTSETNNIVSWGSTSDASNVQFRTTTGGVLQFGSHPNGGGWQAVASSRAVNTGEWVHVAVTKSGNDVKLYINGVEAASGTNTNSMTVDRMTIAKYYEGPEGEVFAGSIDEVRLWNDVRTETEIRQNMYRQLEDPASETNLVSYYRFNESDGDTTAIDSKGDRDGTLTNMTGNEWETSPAMFGPKNCLEFDGSNDYVRVDSPPTFSSTITVEAWVKTTSSANEREIVGWGHTSGSHVVEFRAGGGKLQFGMWNGISWDQVQSSRNINSGNWTHAAVVKEGRIHQAVCGR